MTTDTRTAILDLAEQLVRSRSFNAFSYQDIADGIGIRKASIHYHFPSKEDLGVALIERFRRGVVAWASALVEAGTAPRDRLLAYFELQAETLRPGNMICLHGVLGAEYNALPERVRESYLDFLEEQQTWLGRLLAKGQAQGVFATDATPEDQAALIQSAVQGALQLARASGKPERFHAVLNELKVRVLGSGDSC
jgi:TetR/AcrR family transcriptional regulator, transcriptional repressor for nem operon